MAGRVVVSTLNNDTGVLATQNGMTGICKAWANFQGGNGNTGGAVNGSFNVSSVVRNSTGDYTINFATAMPNANYVVSGTVKENINGSTGDMYLTIYESSTNPATTSVRVNSIFGSGTLYDVNSVYVMIVGS